MKSGKEKIYQLIKWFRRNRLIQKIRSIDVSKQYLIIFFIIVFYFIIWNLYNIKHFEIDDNSARYLLSALLQSQAAIIAIVITMTMVAVQFTASAYSPRVIDIFKHNVVMWRLLLLYGFSIFYGVFLLETIGGKYSIINPWSITFSLEFCIFIAFFIGIVSFGGLFWHVGNIINILKPKKIIEKLSEDITIEKVLEFIESEENKSEDRTQIVKEDPVQPIVDIIHGSVMKYDIATTRIGLETITDRMIDIIHSDCEKEISGIFCNHLERIGKLAVSKENGESAILVLENLESFGKLTVQMKLEHAVQQVAWSLYSVGKVAAEKEIEKAALQTVESLGDIGKAATENKLESAEYQAVKSLGVVGRIATENILKEAASEAIESLGDFGKIAAENKIEGVARSAISSLRDIGKAAAGNELENVVIEALESLNYIGRTSVETEFELVALQTVGFIREVGQAAVENKLEDATSIAVVLSETLEKQLKKKSSKR